jgi:hypothetical protein
MRRFGEVAGDEFGEEEMKVESVFGNIKMLKRRIFA